MGEGPGCGPRLGKRGCGAAVLPARDALLFAAIVFRNAARVAENASGIGSVRDAAHNTHTLQGCFVLKCAN
jgi:hypothetical protein